MNEDRINVWRTEEICSCNVCLAKNYGTGQYRTDNLISIRIGSSVVSVCHRCALRLCQEIEPYI